MFKIEKKYYIYNNVITKLQIKVEGKKCQN